MSGGHRPRVTVLMPVYDGERFLAEAVDSVLGQTWTDLELLIVDDGSTDRSGAIADTYAAADPRVRVVHVAHAGLVRALNRGLESIDSELIARADADDVNEPERLARQIAYLDARPEVGVCGTAMRTIPDGQSWTRPQPPDELSATLVFAVPFYHPTVVMRRDWIARSGARYDPDFQHAEDYDFWERVDQHTRFANLPDALVRYRRHPGQTSIGHATTQAGHGRRVSRRRLERLGLIPTATEAVLHQDIAGAIAGRSVERLEAAGRWLERLQDANRTARCYPEPAFSRVLASYWYRNCVEAVLHSVPAAPLFDRSALARALPDALRRRVRLRLLRLLPSTVTRRIWGRP